MYSTECETLVKSAIYIFYPFSLEVKYLYDLTTRLAHQIFYPRLTPDHHQVPQLCNVCSYWRRSTRFPSHVATKHLARVPHLPQKTEESQTKNARLLPFLQDRSLWWQVLKMRIHFRANKKSLPGLFFDAFCSKYWERLRLPLHHTHTATGSPAGIKGGFTRDRMSMRKEIHRV